MPRPREFDQQAVVDAAMQAFWGQGLATTSVDALLQATGLARSSMYQCLGNRDAVLDMAVRRYVDLQVEAIGRLFAGDSLAASLEAVLEDAALHNFDGRGCLLTNGVHELHGGDASCMAVVREGLARIAEALRQAIARVAPPGTDAAQRSVEVMVAIAGLRALQRGGLPETRLRAAARRYAAWLAAD